MKEPKKNQSTSYSATYSTDPRFDAAIKNTYAVVEASNKRWVEAAVQYMRSLPKVTKKPGAPGPS
jgi:hypothetical protein